METTCWLLRMTQSPLGFQSRVLGHIQFPHIVVDLVSLFRIAPDPYQLRYVLWHAATVILGRGRCLIVPCQC